jgi:hypothetical protein
MALPPVNPRATELGNIFRTLGSGSPDLGFKTDMAAVEAKDAELKAYLGTTDYSAQNQEANDLAKLQFALSLMGRGFASMGAAPGPGESALGAVGRTLVAPLAGDISTIAGPLMKQRAATRLAEQQEERQRKMAAYTATGISAKEQRALAEKLLGDVAKPAAIKQGNRGFARRYENGKPVGPVVPLQYTFDPNTTAYTARTVGEGGPRAAVILSGENRTHIITNEAGEMLGGAGKGDDKYTDNLVVADKATGEPLVDSLGRRIQVSRKGNQLFRLGFPLDVYNQPANTKLVSAAKFETADSDGNKETDAQRKAAANRALLFSSMNLFQNQKLEGDNTPWSANSALFWDQAAYINNGNKLLGKDGNFAIKYIRPGTLPAEAASKAVTITNPNVIEFITNKAHALAEATLTSSLGDVSQEIKTARLERAVKDLLSPSAATLFGASPIEVIGKAEGQNVGYVPGAAALDPAVQKQALIAAFSTVKGNPNANASLTFSPIDIPRSEEGLNKTGGRVVVATRAFPEAFGAPQVPGNSSTYDSQREQQRRDVESVLPSVRLLVGASIPEYRTILAEAAEKKAVERNKQQNSVDARVAREGFNYALEFRRALLDFKNAAAESNVEGFFTGTAAGLSARLGFSEWISGSGSEHWSRLSIASERLQEGISRRVGKDFGDDRISNYDAMAYKKLVADIRSGAAYNRILVNDGLQRIGRDMTDLMAYGGKVGWTERDLEQAAEAGVDFSKLKTMENWHGYGYYGEDRYISTRQQPLSLSQAQRNNIRTRGQLKDTMYGGTYKVPDVNYLTDALPTFQRGTEKTGQGPAIAPTNLLRKGPLQFQKYVEDLASAAGVSVDVMRERVVRGIISYNTFRDQIK